MVKFYSTYSKTASQEEKCLSSRLASFFEIEEIGNCGKRREEKEEIGDPSRRISNSSRGKEKLDIFR